MFEPVIDDEEIRAVVNSKEAEGIFISGKDEFYLEYNSIKYKFIKNIPRPTCSFIKRGGQKLYTIYTICL